MNAYVLYSLHQPWFIFCLGLKFALQLGGNATYPFLKSSLSLSLSLSLVSSHSLCLIGSVISPHSAWCLLIWQRDCLPDRCCCLYCLVLHLTNSSKGKEREWEKIAENQAVLHNWLCKSACQNLCLPMVHEMCVCSSDVAHISFLLPLTTGDDILSHWLLCEEVYVLAIISMSMSLYICLLRWQQ